MPSNQTIADIFKGEWFTSFPARYRVKAGSVSHFDFSVDPRVSWVDSLPGNKLRGKRIIELGPYEAYNTWQMRQLGAREIISIENNKISYLKCLIVKEITGMNARFLHGDFIQYLDYCVKSNETTDFIWASGVLYHQEEPLRLLELISRVTSKVFFHTHYYDEERISTNPALKAFFDHGKNQVHERDGLKIELFYKSYNNTNKGAAFSGGSSDFSYWMKKDDLFAFLKSLGFVVITIEVDTPDHPNGPGICFMAEKEPKTQEVSTPILVD